MIADIRLRKFDMKTLKAGSVAVLIGKRETGKSFLRARPCALTGTKNLV